MVAGVAKIKDIWIFSLVFFSVLFQIVVKTVHDIKSFSFFKIILYVLGDNDEQGGLQIRTARGKTAAMSATQL